MSPLSWLVALDLDGTTLTEDGSVSAAVLEQIRRLDAAGHHVVITTGRSAATTIPVLTQLGIGPEYLICSNGAVTLRRTGSAYRRERVVLFDPGDTLRAIRSHLPGVRVAVEDENGTYRFTAAFPAATTGLDHHTVRVPFEDLLLRPATRVVAISPEHDAAEFAAVVRRMGLRQVTYAMGWSSWLDIAAEGVDKARAGEEVRVRLGIRRERVMAVGDGHNDLELLRWAAEHGRGVAMGNAPVELIAVANEVTGTVHQDGLAVVLATLPA